MELTALARRKGSISRCLRKRSRTRAKPLSHLTVLPTYYFKRLNCWNVILYRRTFPKTLQLRGNSSRRRQWRISTGEGGVGPKPENIVRLSQNQKWGYRRSFRRQKTESRKSNIVKFHEVVKPIFIRRHHFSICRFSSYYTRRQTCKIIRTKRSFLFSQSVFLLSGIHKGKSLLFSS